MGNADLREVFWVKRCYFSNLKIKSLISDTLLVTHMQNLENHVYIDTIPGNSDYPIYYKKYLDGNLNGLEHLRSPYVTLEKNGEVYEKFKFKSNKDLIYIVRVFNVKAKNGIKIKIVLRPNKYINYLNPKDSYRIESIEEITDFYQ